MSAPVASYIIQPNDGGNTGPSLRTRRRLVGGSWVDEMVLIKSWAPDEITGVYVSQIPIQSVQQNAQDGTTTGFAWIQNPTTSTKKLRVRRIFIRHTAITGGTVSDHASAPRIAFARGTHADGWAGATNQIVDRKTTDPNPSFDIRTAATGAASLALGAIIWASLVPGVTITTSDVYNPRFTETWLPKMSDDQIVIAPGECLIIYQPDNGTASDVRRFTVDLTFDEFST